MIEKIIADKTDLEHMADSIRTLLNSNSLMGIETMKTNLRNYAENSDSSGGGLDTSDATATAYDIAFGKTAYVDGLKITGNISTFESEDSKFLDSVDRSISESATDFMLKGQYEYDTLMRSGSSLWVRTPLESFGNATPADVTQGKTFTSSAGFKATGTKVDSGNSGGIDTSDATATAGDIYIGKTAYVNGQKIIGTMETIQQYNVSAIATLNEDENSSVTLSPVSGPISARVWSGIAPIYTNDTYTFQGFKAFSSLLANMDFYSSAKNYIINSISATMGGSTFDLSNYITLNDNSYADTNPLHKDYYVEDLPVSGDIIFRVDARECYQVSSSATNATISTPSSWVAHASHFSFTVTPENGYSISKNNLSILEGEATVSTERINFEVDTSTGIASVTVADVIGNLTISAIGTAEEKHTVTINQTDNISDSIIVDFVSGGEEMNDGELLTVIFTPTLDGKAINDLSATLDGESFSISNYVSILDSELENTSNKIFRIDNLPVTGDLIINLTGVIYYKIEALAVNGSASGTTYRKPGGSARLTFSPSDGYGISSEDGSIGQDWLTASYLSFTSEGTTLDNEMFKGRATLSFSGGKYSLQLNSLPAQNLTVTMIFTSLSSYSVENEEGATYGFALNANNYYESQNVGVSNSAALARINLDVPETKKVRISFINSGEANSSVAYDYGSFGLLDTLLNTSSTTDSSTLLKWQGNTSALHSTEIQTIEYDVPAGEHFIIAKYRKNSNVDNGNDSLQFKVEFI